MRGVAHSLQPFWCPRVGEFTPMLLLCSLESRDQEFIATIFLFQALQSKGC